MAKTETDRVIGPRVKAYLDSKGITQHWLASKLDMSDKNMSLRLAGKTGVTLDEYYKIVDALDLEPGAFMEV